MVKVLDSPLPGSSDRGSSPVSPKIFLLGKKGKKKAASLLCLSFSPQRVARLSPASHLKGIMGKNHFCGLELCNSAAAYDAPRSLMRQLAIAQWLVRPAVNLHNITPFSLH